MEALTPPDREFMSRLYLDYYSYIRKIICRITNDEHSSEDLAHDTMLKLIKQVPLLRGLNGTKLAVYIDTAAKNTARDFIRHNANQRKHLFFTDEIEHVAEQSKENRDEVMRSLLLKSSIASVRKAAQKLLGQHKNVLRFKYVYEKTDLEISEELGIARNSVRMYLTRARRALLETLDEDGDDRDK